MESTTVSPEDVRAAAHAIIIDGLEGASVAKRLAGIAWRDLLLGMFLLHQSELLQLSPQYPPTSAPELRLLEYCLEAVTVEAECELIRAAMAPVNSTVRSVQHDIAHLGYVTVIAAIKENRAYETYLYQFDAFGRFLAAFKDDGKIDPVWLRQFEIDFGPGYAVMLAPPEVIEAYEGDTSLPFAILVITRVVGSTIHLAIRDRMPFVEPIMGLRFTS